MTDGQPENNMTIIKSPKSNLPRFLWIGAAVVAIVALVLVYRTGYISFHGLSAQPTSSPVASATGGTNLESCDVTKEGNPLVDGNIQTITLPSGKVLVGTFRGNINNLTFNSSRSSVDLELISPKGDQNHVFSLSEEKGLVHDAIDLKDLTLADLKKGETVVMSFNCYFNQGKKFKITRIEVTGK